MISSSFCLIVSQATSSPSAVVVPAAEESLEGEDPAGGLDPLVVDRPADGRDVDVDPVGDLLHLERLDRLRALVEEVLLVLDDRAGDLEEGVPPLLDRLDQPAGRLDLLLDELAGGRVGLLVLEQLLIIPRDRQLRRVLVEQPDLYSPCSSGSTIRSGTTYWALFGGERRRRASG